jgi:6-phosphogluconolactonase
MDGLRVLTDAEQLTEVAAKRIADLASTAIARRGRFVVALSGGSTPRPMYRLLAREPYASAVDWSCVELLWGDERCVPPDHPDSNYRMARRALLDRVGIPANRVHRIKGELPPQEAAAAYRAELETVLGEEGRFDLVLLGLGTDGHTASLFPGTWAVEEREQDAVAVYVERLDSWRVTLTLPIINDARHVIFLVSGQRKADVLSRVCSISAWPPDQQTVPSRAPQADAMLSGSPSELPAQLVQPTDGTLTWLVDSEAAAVLSSRDGVGADG